MSRSLDQLLNLCLRARRLVSGGEAVTKALNDGKVHLLFMASDASGRTREQFRKQAMAKRVPLASYGTKLEWGRLLQKPPRSVVAVTDKEFARGMVRALERGEGHIMGG